MDLTELMKIVDNERQSAKPTQIKCCAAAGCISVNSQIVQQQLEEVVKASGLENGVLFPKTALSKTTTTVYCSIK